MDLIADLKAHCGGGRVVGPQWPRNASPVLLINLSISAVRDIVDAKEQRNTRARAQGRGEDSQPSLLSSVAAKKRRRSAAASDLAAANELPCLPDRASATSKNGPTRSVPSVVEDFPQRMVHAGAIQHEV